MKTLGLREARAEFSAVLNRVAKGERFLIAKHGVPFAQLLPVASAAGREQARARLGAKKKKSKARRK
jgi:prevent-host-death family protein